MYFGHKSGVARFGRLDFSVHLPKTCTSTSMTAHEWITTCINCLFSYIMLQRLKARSSFVPYRLWSYDLKISGFKVSDLCKKRKAHLISTTQGEICDDDPALKHQVRYCISKPSQGVTVAILAWPPHEAAAAFGTRPGRAGTVPDRLEGSDGTPFRSRAWPWVEYNTEQHKHTRCVRARCRGLLRTLSWGYALLLVLIRCWYLS